MKNKKIQQIFITSITLTIVMLLVSGGTFAYMAWQSTDGTLINIKVTDDIQMTIEPEPINTTKMYPTMYCGGPAAISGNAKVTIVNNTGIKAKPRFKLKVKIIPTSNKAALQANHLISIRYAVFEGKDATCTQSGSTIQNTIATGAFPGTNNPASSTWYHTSNYLRKTPNTGTDWVTFEAAPKTTTTHWYTVWAWIDSTYDPSALGISNLEDPLQNAQIAVTWSENSIVEQVGS